MKTMFSATPFLSCLLLLSLSICILATPSSSDSRVHSNKLARDLPKSSDVPPPDAASIYSSPGPVIPNSLPPTTSDLPQASPSPSAGLGAGNADNYNVDFESKSSLAATDDSDSMDETRTHIPSVSEMDAMIAAHSSGSASDKMMQVTTALMAPMVLSVLLL